MPRPSNAAIRMAVLALLLAAPAVADEATGGPARVIDALTLEVGGTVMRLQGIAAPRPGESCTIRGAVQPDCGALAATQLMDLTFGATVNCTAFGPVQEGARPARCTNAGYDLAHGMVHSGWARALPGAPAALHRIEAEARAAGRGLWQDGFPASVERAAAGG